MLRDMPEASLSFASAPLPSPDTHGAKWALSTRSDRRIIYGVPGEPALLALECLEVSETSEPELAIIRFSPADEGAGALLAFVGNGHIGRIKVDASELGEKTVWQGQLSATDSSWEPLVGPRELTATVPGAGMVALNPSSIPGLLIAACRLGEDLNKGDVSGFQGEDILSPDAEVSPAFSRPLTK